MRPISSKAWRVGAYVGALVASGVAGLLQEALWPYIPPSPQLLFYPTVVCVAWLGGLGPGLVATVASSAIIVFWFIPPLRSFAVDAAGDAVDLAIFTVISASLSVLIARTRAAERSSTVARLRAEEATAAKNRVLAVVSHDLKTPLAAIGLGARTIERALQRGELSAVNECAVRIRRCARRADELVAEVLDVATLAPSELRLAPADVSLESIVSEVRDAAKVLSDERGVTLEETWDDALVRCDRARIVRVLTNLVVNAIRFTPRGGQVSIHAARLDDRSARLSVRDTGVGIAPEQIPLVFQPRWRGEGSEGHGLGLDIARRIVEAHGRTLEVDSALGAGSVFRFDLPLAELRPSATRSAIPSGPAASIPIEAPSLPHGRP